MEEDSSATVPESQEPTHLHAATSQQDIEAQQEPRSQHAAAEDAVERAPGGVPGDAAAERKDPLTEKELVEVFEKKQRALRNHGIVGVLGVVFEDGVQTFATLYVELVCRPGVMIGGETFALSGISTAAALSLVAGVINATFKIYAGCRQYKMGPLDTIGLADRTIKCASLLPLALT